ncbi:ATP synthase F1 subunit delta [Salinicoccus kekensis]|uniref:ATP synthase subunit delta n=1 Tax=Salinicoccus kekensis TaxID=714307 RepID=A0A285UMR6_9STAP|nr:ATP synthase F1 subunit delta [Salinicoccus kekensis]SOC42688.1 ATP synthase F1 subcomplex delta subunit [Salinicoccus kekensis]
MAISANNYSKALFNAIHDDETLNKVRDDFSEVMESVRNVPAFHDFISNPKISRDERKAVVENTFKEVEKPLFNMLRVLSDKGKMTHIESIYEDFIKLYNAHFNQAYVTVESVYKLSGEELDEIGKTFIKKTGLKKLLIENEVNEDLIGGIRVFIDTKVYDASIRGQLNTLKGQFKAHANS